jgi:hypothetical protein
MTPFEYIFAVASILIGLAITELLTGFSRVLRHELKLSWLHLLWVIVVFQVQLQLAWGFWNLRSKENWLYPEFLLVISGPVLLYIAASVLFPRSSATDQNLGIHLLERRRSFFLVMATYVAFTGLLGAVFFNQPLFQIGSTTLRVVAIASFVVLAITDKLRVHWVLALAALLSQLIFTYLYSFSITAAVAA